MPAASLMSSKVPSPRFRYSRLNSLAYDKGPGYGAVLPGSGPYDAAKWGVIGMGKSIAVELAARGIRVNTVSPGLLDTQIWQDILAAAPSRDECLRHWRANIPIGRVIEPQEIGSLVAFLLSDRCPALTGANILHDGGMTSQLVSREPYESRPIEGGR